MSIRYCAICGAKINELHFYSVGWLPDHVFCSLEHLEQGTGRSSDDPKAFVECLNDEGEVVPWDEMMGSEG